MPETLSPPRQGANGDVGAPERFTAGQAWLQEGPAFAPFQTGRPTARAGLKLDKKIQTAEHFVITLRRVGKARPAAVICTEWIQSAGPGEREPYCEGTLLQQ